MNIYQDDSKISIFNEIRTSESDYRLNLSKLLGCCSPLKTNSSHQFNSNISNENAAFTKIIRKLIAYHTELIQKIDSLDNELNSANFIKWCYMSLSIYKNYIKLYGINQDDLDIVIDLKQKPLIKLQEIYTQLIRLNTDSDLISNYNKLILNFKDKIQQEIFKLDQSIFNFNKITELNDELSKSLSYFNRDEILKRDYFKFEILNHPSLSISNKLIELIQLKNNQLAICSVELIGRDLLFPPINLVQDFEILQNDCENIIIVKKIFNYELKFKCIDSIQMTDWNKNLNEIYLNSIDKFHEKFGKLNSLNSNLGLGLQFDQLRKSTTKIDSLPLQDITNTSIKNKPKPLVLKTSNFDSLNSNIKSQELNQTNEKQIKIKKRKSIFNLFKSSSSKEPIFEIVTKDTQPRIIGKEQNQSELTQTLAEKLNLSPSSYQQMEEEIDSNILDNCYQKPTVLNNSIILSKWIDNKWMKLGEDYQNSVEFYYNHQYLLMKIQIEKFHQNPIIIQMNHDNTSISRSSALDLQIKTPISSSNNSNMVMFNIRCKDYKISQFILNESQTNGLINNDHTTSSSASVFSEKPSNSTSMSSISIHHQNPSTISLNKPPSFYSIANSSSTLTLSSPSPTRTLNELLLKNNLLIKLHKLDSDGDWIPLSMASLSIFAIVSTDNFYKFCIQCSQIQLELTPIVENSSLKKLGRTGLKFSCIIDDTGDEYNYLCEFRNSIECDEIYELLKQ
ncbi:hypothetical protein WICMUC_000196 [Wickerhamomyces mucosus]|uniref:Uncharacterized protein n=1 Tax=Wickerhamomyces mucosus TaxID=1378264 RepID=A0A9P8Q0M1_9ASCO|nr:hypothetical protein WICMUC_000196 [Wickerhamomyces mucosus]